VQRVIIVTTTRLRVPGFWVPFALWIVGSRVATAAWALVLWWLLIGRYSVERRRRLATSLKVEIVEPYFLKRVEEHSDVG